MIKFSKDRAAAANRTKLVMVVLFLSSLLLAQNQNAPGQDTITSFPGPDFILRDEDSKPQKGRMVLGQDDKGGTTFATYGGSSNVQTYSLSLSGDGKLLAVGSTPGRIDLWDVENKKKLRTLEGGSTVGLSRDGHLLAKDGKDGSGIELYDVGSGKLLRQIPRVLKRAENTVDKFEFSAGGSLLDVTANGDDDMVYDVSSGKLLATLANTKHAEFSKDGSLLIGGNYQHLIEWNTKGWTKVRDLPNGPDYVTRIAAFPEGDLVVVGGPKVALLRRLSSGEEVASVGAGFTNFAAFNRGGTLIFTYSASSGSGFSVWTTAGRRICSRQDLGNGTAALSANGRWLAAAPKNGGTTVAIWDMQNALNACGASARQ
jgi:WD40 repeat protein